MNGIEQTAVAVLDVHPGRMLVDPNAALQVMARTRFPLWQPHRSAYFRIQPLQAQKPRWRVSASIIPWLVNLDLIAPTDDFDPYAGTVFILTAEGWRLARLGEKAPTTRHSSDALTLGHR